NPTGIAEGESNRADDPAEIDFVENSLLAARDPDARHRPEHRAAVAGHQYERHGAFGEPYAVNARDAALLFTQQDMTARLRGVRRRFRPRADRDDRIIAHVRVQADDTRETARSSNDQMHVARSLRHGHDGPAD